MHLKLITSGIIVVLGFVIEIILLNKVKTNLNFIEDISSVDKSAYERLLNTNDSPFIKHSFLEALETSGCVSDIKGWKLTTFIKKDGLGWFFTNLS